MGMPEYSYYFVLKGFLPVLRSIGRVYTVSNPEREVDELYDDRKKCGEDCLYISFTPPSKALVGLRCPTVCVFAWEFDRIPDEVWDDNPKNDWTHVLSSHGRAITLSKHTAQAVKNALGEWFDVAAIPVPVWDHFELYRKRILIENPITHIDIIFDGNIVDSKNYRITPESFEILNSKDFFHLQNWMGEKLRAGFSETDEYSAYLGGFYKPENWGTWSRIDSPWILLPFRLTGKVHLSLTVHGYGHNINRKIGVSIGGVQKRIRLLSVPVKHHLLFDLTKTDNIIQFSDLDLTPWEGARDPRSLGIGLQSIELWGDPVRHPKDNSGIEKINKKKIAIDGVVYTSVFSPADGRKNWKDIVTAFCYAFQDVPDATLVLKMSHHALSSFLGKLHFLLQQMYPFKCRILALHGYLDTPEYESLISVTKYYVNASRCEGLCLPLMEFMACCKPAISPYHTAMADYVDPSFAFIVNANLEPCMYPHETRDIYRTRRYRIDWKSLVDAYRHSYDVFKNNPDSYKRMCHSASSGIEKFSSIKRVKEQFMDFIGKDNAN